MVMLNILSNARLQAGWKKLVMLSVWIICEPVLAVAQSDIPRLDITEGQIEPIPVAIADFTGPNGKPSAVRTVPKVKSIAHSTRQKWWLEERRSFAAQRVLKITDPNFSCLT